MLNSKIKVSREVYVPYTEQRGASVVSVRYLGHGLRREEHLSYQVASDWCEGGTVRRAFISPPGPSVSPMHWSTPYLLGMS